MRALALLFFASSVLMLSAPYGAEAQFSDMGTITVGINPQYPRPYSVVVATPRSTQINLAMSEVTITANGVVVEKGSGSRSASVVLGGPGSATTIQVTALYAGQTYSTEVIIRPADVSLILEPLSTTHPLYKGGSLVAPEGPVRIVTLTDFRSSNGTRIPSNSLSYVWRLGNRILTEESGVGRSVLEATAPVRYRNADVSVTVTDASETIVGFAQTKVSPASPKVLAYTSDPLLGIDLVHAVSSNFFMREEEESFELLPFFFKEEPSVTWTLNGSTASSDLGLTVRSEGASAGSAAVSVSASDGSGETARTSFTVNFRGRSSGTGIFGF
jgi:hypothetical protein